MLGPARVCWVCLRNVLRSLLDQITVVGKALKRDQYFLIPNGIPKRPSHIPSDVEHVSENKADDSGAPVVLELDL